MVIELNIEQLNSLAKIVAEELSKVKFADSTLKPGQNHLTRNGRIAYEVSFQRKLGLTGPGSLNCFYHVRTTDENELVCYPHPLTQRIMVNDVKSLAEYERHRIEMLRFRDHNEEIQKFLEAISSGTRQSGALETEQSWLIDPKKTFQYLGMMIDPIKVEA